MPPDDIQRVVDARQARKDYNPFNPITVASNVDRDAVMRLSEHQLDMPGVQVGVESTRRYTDGTLISHIIGYMGAISPDDADQLQQQGYGLDDHIGAAGVEQAYEKDLRGVPGRRSYQVEVSGQEVGELQREPPGLATTWCCRSTSTCSATSPASCKRACGTRLAGAAIVMDPRNGEILAMVSTPSFDAISSATRHATTSFGNCSTTRKRRRCSRAPTPGQYPPGSVFKLVVGSAALQEGVANRDTVIDSKGRHVRRVRRVPRACASPSTTTPPTGPADFFQGIANSSNIYFFYLGGGYQEGNKTLFEGLGVDRLAKYARAFGYGSRTGLDISGEQDGTIPDPTWKQFHKDQPWFKGDTYNMSIGQGDVLATPLQVANTTNVIANGGTLYQPHLARQELDSDGNVVKGLLAESAAAGSARAGRSANLAIMRQAMEWGFEGPWLKWFKIPGLRVAGKTGTAEYQGPPDGNLPTHGWFTSFAPADNPEITVTVFVESGSGTNDASPIGARIIRRYFHQPDVSPDAPKLPLVTTAPNRPPKPPAPRPRPGPEATRSRGRATAARVAVEKGVVERDDAVHHPHVGTDPVRPQPSADALSDHPSEAIQLLVGAQLDPQLRLRRDRPRVDDAAHGHLLRPTRIAAPTSRPTTACTCGSRSAGPR